MVGKPLEWEALDNQPYIHLISRGVFIESQSPFNGLQQEGYTPWN